MEPIVTMLDEVVVSGNRSGRKASEETKSIDVLKGPVLLNSNPTKVSDVLSKAPGVYMLDGQVNMRGGTGFTYGAGSRTQLIVDDLPMISADRGDAKWEFVPMENTEQIEVLKGAASVMYGSSALNGVVHITTAWPKPNKPENQYTLMLTPIFNPKNELNKWWTITPISKNFSGLHRKKIKNVDLVVGYAAASQESHLKDEVNDFGRFNIKTRVHSNKIKGLTYGINANANMIKTQLFFLWSAKPSYPNFLPFGGNANEPGTSVRKFRYLWYSIDPHLTYYTKSGGRYSYRGRMYANTFLDFIRLKINNQAYFFQNELQYSKEIIKNVNLVTGANFNYFKVIDGTLGKHRGTRGAVFAQVSHKYRRLASSFGVRVDAISNDTLTTLLPVVYEGGLTLDLGRSFYLHTAAGQGFRLPSIAEMFVLENLGGLSIFPNTELLPEKGWNAELGLKKGFKISNWSGYIDATAYVTETKNLTEFLFKSNWVVPYNGSYVGGLGFRSVNLEKSRVGGIELSTQASGSIGKIPLVLIGGYTYAFPADLSNNSPLNNFKKYTQAAVYAFNRYDSTVNAQIMLYRYRHIKRIDIETGYKKFTFGGSINFYSGVEKVDPTFQFILINLNNYIQDNLKGNTIFLLRAGYRFSPIHSINVVLNNVSNREYALRPTKLDAPRNISIQYRVNL
jgi:iron complex outermembrane receptor protein